MGRTRSVYSRQQLLEIGPQRDTVKACSCNMCMQENASEFVPFTSEQHIFRRLSSKITVLYVMCVQVQVQVRTLSLNIMIHCITINKVCSEIVNKAHYRSPDPHLPKYVCPRILPGQCGHPAIPAKTNMKLANVDSTCTAVQKDIQVRVVWC